MSKIPDKDILMKELELIDSTITRLDQQIQTSKNVCFTVWAAWNGWFISIDNFEYLWLTLLVSSTFPAIFWKVDSFYRAALISSSNRQTLISIYLNKNRSSNDFPLLAPVGGLYKEYSPNELINSSKHDIDFEQKKKLLEEDNNAKYTYKEVLWIYPPLILLSLFGGTAILVYELICCLMSKLCQ